MAAEICRGKRERASVSQPRCNSVHIVTAIIERRKLLLCSLGDDFIMCCRTERVRRWDHLRKSHDLTTCEKCSIRLFRADCAAHETICTGSRSQWLSGEQVTPGELQGNGFQNILFYVFSSKFYMMTSSDQTSQRDAPVTPALRKLITLPC